MDPTGDISDSVPPLAPPRPFFLAGSRSSSQVRAPPSAFPFQAYPGNPDPLPSPSSYTYSRRRASLESLANGIPAYAYSSRSGSLSDLHKPQPPFVNDTGADSRYHASAAAQIPQSRTSTPPGTPTIQQSPSQIFRAPFLSPASRPSSSLWSYREAPPATAGSTTALPLSSILQSRPPLPSTLLVRTPPESTAHSLPKEDTPLDAKTVDGTYRPDKDKKTPRDRTAYLLTLLCVLLGAAGSALLCWTGVRNVRAGMLDESKLCLVVDEDFRSGSLDASRWGREVEASGFGNGEFQLTTASERNIYFKNGQLYIMPTLTREVVPDIDQDGKTFSLEGCTGAAPAPAPPPAANSTAGGGRPRTSTSTRGGPRPTPTPIPDEDDDRIGIRKRQARPAGNATTTPAASGNTCTAVTNHALGTVIHPVMSGRISTRGKVGIKYGRVEVRAKLARGDWLWPAIWMLPENNTYGAWPLSGEIDIMEGRGNAPSYPAQGLNYIRSALNFGLDRSLVPITVPGGAAPTPLTKHLFGWFNLKRTSFDRAFHTYAVEWDEKFIRFWVDSRVWSVLDIRVHKEKALGKGRKGEGEFWERGRYVYVSLCFLGAGALIECYAYAQVPADGAEWDHGRCRGRQESVGAWVT
ncbi:hypothetical protein DXG03_005683 [Asterophora parasitica]|uniref:GH16 domain-containing protein n=1 Tax=Asterophora parasitica TaxID=117018 RepID=A0A9P7G353_9AGAR|nr:hypothetical protein DXG03_005683 [Asterophora parasitica]